MATSEAEEEEAGRRACWSFVLFFSSFCLESRVSSFCALFLSLSFFKQQIYLAPCHYDALGDQARGREESAEGRIRKRGGRGRGRRRSDNDGVERRRRGQQRRRGFLRSKGDGGGLGRTQGEGEDDEKGEEGRGTAGWAS